MTRLLRLTFLLGVLGTLYIARGRRWVLSWGASEDERARRLPGDEILAAPAIQTTRVVTVDAPPEAIWPWLVQMGPRPRAGVYTYDWIERRLGIDIENADRVLPEFQHLEAGEYFRLDDRQGLRVLEVRPREAIVLQWEPQQSTWAFVLDPDGAGRTRLISRNRVAGRGPGFWLAMLLFMEPGSLVMERKMLLTIKRHAEATPVALLPPPSGPEPATP